jgi:hypothetical protein
MDIDKTDFVNALAESGSTITIGVTPSKCFFVLLQSDKHLPDVHLKSGDAIAYVDPATSVTIGDSATYQGREFTLISKVKVKYIGDNPIYRLLGFQLSSRLPPSLLIASTYSYEEISSEDVSASFFLPSVYSYEEISSENVSAGFFLPASYTISSELFSLAIFSSYSYEEISSESVSASFFLPSVYSYEEISSENVSAGFFLPASYTISSELFSLSIFSTYSYEEISSENVSASFFLPSVYSYEEISSENVSAGFFLPASYTISSELFSLSIFSSYSYEEISSENVSASFFLPSVYSYEEISSENVSAGFFLPASYTISSELFSLSIFSSYSYEEISSEDVSASFFLPSVYSYEEISSENISASFFLPASYTISSELFSLSIFSAYSYEEISSELISASFFLPSVYSYEEISSELISASFTLYTSYSILHYPTVSFDSVPLVNPQMQDMYYRVLTGDVTLLSGKQSVQSSSEIALTVKFICSTFNHADVTNLRAKIGTNATLVIGSDSFSCYINAKAFVERQTRENNATKYEYEVEFIEHTA